MNIYIPEHIPSGNKGEEAILQGIYQGLKDEAKDVTISVFSHTPEIDRINYGNQFEVIEGITFRPASGKGMFLKISETIVIWLKHFLFLLLWRFIGEKCLRCFRGGNWKAYLDADVILVGHDGVLSDMNLLFALFAKGIGKKGAIFGCGFRSFRFKVTEKLVPFFMSLIDLIVLREKRSYDYLISLGVRSNNIFMKPDPAFLMKPAERSAVDRFFENEQLFSRKKPLIGMVAIRGSAHFSEFHEYVTDKDEKYKKHIEFYSEMVEKVLEITSGTVVFLPHSVQSSYGRDDRICSRDVKAGMKKFQDDVILIESEYNAAVLKGVIQRLDFLVSQRLHSIIGAASVGTPFIMVTVKGDGRAQDIVEHTIAMPDLLFDLNDPHIEDFARKFKELWSSSEKIRKELLMRAVSIHKGCEESARLLAGLL